MKKFIKLKLFSQQVASNSWGFKKFARKCRDIFTICHYSGKIFLGAFMKNFFRIWTTFFALTFAAIFFAACGDMGSDENVKYVTLTGGEGHPGKYTISEYSNGTGEYFTNGYIYSGKFSSIKISSSNEKGDAVAEFKIVDSLYPKLRIEIYEGQTLPSDNYLYVYYGDKGEIPQSIGEIKIIKIDGKPEFIYEEYDYYDDYDLYW